MQPAKLSNTSMAILNMFALQILSAQEKIFLSGQLGFTSIIKQKKLKQKNSACLRAILHLPQRYLLTQNQRLHPIIQKHLHQIRKSNHNHDIEPNLQYPVVDESQV